MRGSKPQKLIGPRRAPRRGFQSAGVASQAALVLEVDPARERHSRERATHVGNACLDLAERRRAGGPGPGPR